MNETERPTIHYSQIADPPADSELYSEWLTYRRELPRLLAEGHEGKYVLIKGDTILGPFEADTTAFEEGYCRFLKQPFMVQQVRSEEPLYHLAGAYWPCPS